MADSHCSPTLCRAIDIVLRYWPNPPSAADIMRDMGYTKWTAYHWAAAAKAAFDAHERRRPLE